MKYVDRILKEWTVAAAHHGWTAFARWLWRTSLEKKKFYRLSVSKITYEGNPCFPG